MVLARNEGRNIKTEGPEILADAAKWCQPLRAALDTWGDVTFDYTSTDAPDFEQVVTDKAQGHDAAISCVGVGSGSLSMSEEQMIEVEVNMLGKYARGCKAAEGF